MRERDSVARIRPSSGGDESVVEGVGREEEVGWVGEEWEGEGEAGAVRVRSKRDRKDAGEW